MSKYKGSLKLTIDISKNVKYNYVCFYEINNLVFFLELNENEMLQPAKLNFSDSGLDIKKTLSLPNLDSWFQSKLIRLKNNIK